MELEFANTYCRQWLFVSIYYISLSVVLNHHAIPIFSSVQSLEALLTTSNQSQSLAVCTVSTEYTYTLYNIHNRYTKCHSKHLK